jgi:hypothetical protein
MSTHPRRDFALVGLVLLVVGGVFLAPIWIVPAHGLALVILVFVAGSCWLAAIELFVGAAHGRLTRREENSVGTSVIQLFLELFTKR